MSNLISSGRWQDETPCPSLRLEGYKERSQTFDHYRSPASTARRRNGLANGEQSTPVLRILQQTPLIGNPSRDLIRSKYRVDSGIR